MNALRRIAATALPILLMSVLPLGSVQAADPTTKPAAKDAPISVAILEFEAKDPGNPDLGKQISETLTAVLSGEPGITLVERATLARTLQEQELNLTGLVDTDKAVK